MLDYQIKNIEIGLLKQHEEINDGHLEELLAQIKSDGCIKDPIIVDKNTMVILDGHHRFNSMKSLGLRLCPVCLVDYKNDATITVGCWREGEKITKEEVIAAGLSGNFLKAKTSHHFIPERPTGLNVPLSDLR
jgi:hypothetical protein